jgi:hypothetical protein
MKRHTFDPTSFLAGLVLGAIGLAYLLAEQADWDLDGRWVLPIALIGLGVAGVAGALGGLRRTGPGDPTAGSSSPPAEPVPADGAAPASPPG